MCIFMPKYVWHLLGFAADGIGQEGMPERSGLILKDLVTANNPRNDGLHFRIPSPFHPLSRWIYMFSSFPSERRRQMRK